jgi:peroxin-3
MWAMTLLSLYTRVQVTILGRHLYLDFARSSHRAQIQVDSMLQASHSMLKPLPYR